MMLLSTVTISLRTVMWRTFVVGVSLSWVCSDFVMNCMMLTVIVLLSSPFIEYLR